MTAVTSGKHADSTLTNVHMPFAWEYANASARTATGSFASGDVGKLSWQQDDNTVWILTTTTPTWAQIGSSSVTLEPWLVDILPTVSDPSATTGTWSVGYWDNEGGAGPFGKNMIANVFIPGMQNTSNAQNDAISWDVVLSAGTWNATIWVRKSSNTGIITLNIDGSSAGTADTYNGSAAYAKVTINGWTVSATGKHTVQIKMATKNASSSAYNVGLLSISLRRTA